MHPTHARIGEPALSPASRATRHPPRPAGLLVALLLTACTAADPTDSTGLADSEPCGTDSGTGCAPQSARVDLYQPVFSDPTVITNPLFPIAELESVVFLGLVDGLPFRTETTLLPTTRTIDWNGTPVETLESQYMAFSDGRIEEIATDWYAQDDAGAVWYFGEDVADYNADGVVYTHDGTWRVGVDGAPVTMIMPADPQVGDVYLAENVAPIAWEEVTVTEVDAEADGPAGTVTGVMVGSELHMDGTRQEKVFAPGYGEFSTGSVATDDLEALALAVPTDRLSEPAPAELTTMASELARVFDAAGEGDWPTAAAGEAAGSAAWEAYRAGGVPPLIDAELPALLAALDAAVAAEDGAQTRQLSITVARLVYDLRLRYESRLAIDAVRLDLWCAQVAVDLDAGDYGSLRGDAASASLVWNRVAHAYEGAAAAEIVSLLADLSGAAAAEDGAGVEAAALALRGQLAKQGW